MMRALAIVALLALAACGIKGEPSPPESEVDGTP